MSHTSILQSFSLVCFSLLTFFPIAGSISDAITTTQPLAVGQTLLSAGEVFELGFFSPKSSSKKIYLGIWYKVPKQTVVWVANRDCPVRSSAVLKISRNGNVVLVDRSSTPIWSSNQTSSINTTAQLLDSGNFVLRSANDSDPTNFLWQSFDYPTDTLLPGMKLGWDSKTGLNRYLNSWKSSSDPSSGDYSFKFDVNGLPQVYLRHKKVIQYRSGPWNGVRFSGVPEMSKTSDLKFSFLMNSNEVTYSFELVNISDYSRLIVNPFGVLKRYSWIDSVQGWHLFWYAPKDQCDGYKECGAYGVCGTDYSPVCQCVHGFEPQNPKAWALRDGSGGCVRVSKLGCGGDGFLVLKGVKLPDTAAAIVHGEMSLVECENTCLMNCSCTAFSIMDIREGGFGCVTWIGDLVDMRQYSPNEDGQDLFVRTAASDLEAGSIVSRKKFEEISLMVGLTVAVGGVLLGLSICCIWKREGNQRTLEEKIEGKGPNETSQDVLINDGITVSKRHYSGENPTDELEILLFDFGTIAIATNNFSEENKLGEGGFGCVFKGVLVDGQEIAVKRLSTYSGQGTEEFKNEVRLVARVQHRNLVRLLGCCIEKEEKMLIYECMEHRSLDSILFDPMKCSMLNWQRRFNIICGIARGLLYLHQDSRFKIIHRDLKASNILLDGEMTPKISDFGMARIFEVDQTEANTVRVVGTFGYMPPEYLMDGIFSMKSDVFSFGVLLLEIISGKKNRRFYNAQEDLTLLGHAWLLWEEEKGIELLDSSAGESYPPCEVIRCIQVALLCVQERAEDRPDMSSVVLMLSSNEAASMFQPKLPGISKGKRELKPLASFTKKDEPFTMNELTVTILDGR